MTEIVNTSSNVAPVQTSNMFSKGINLDEIVNAPIFDRYTFLAQCLECAFSDQDSIINFPVLKNAPTSYFMSEGEKKDDHEQTMSTEVKTFNLGALVIPLYFSRQAFNKIDSTDSINSDIINSCMVSMYDAIDNALLSDADVSKSEIQSLVAHCKSENKVDITSDITTLYSFIAKIDAVRQKDAALVMSQTTYNNLVAHCFLSNSNYILNMQDITKDRDLSVLGIPVIITSHLATNKMLYITKGAYMLGMSKTAGIELINHGHGNVKEVSILSLIGGAIADDSLYFIGTITDPVSND